MKSYVQRAWLAICIGGEKCSEPKQGQEEGLQNPVEPQLPSLGPSPLIFNMCLRLRPGVLYFTNVEIISGFNQRFHFSLARWLVDGLDPALSYKGGVLNPRTPQMCGKGYTAIISCTRSASYLFHTSTDDSTLT